MQINYVDVEVDFVLLFIKRNILVLFHQYLYIIYLVLKERYLVRCYLVVVQIFLIERAIIISLFGGSNDLVVISRCTKWKSSCFGHISFSKRFQINHHSYQLSVCLKGNAAK